MIRHKIVLLLQWILLLEIFGSTGIDVVMLFPRVYQYYSDIFQLYGFMSSFRARSQALPGNAYLEALPLACIIIVKNKV